MEKSEIYRTLKKFGLSEYESKAYTSLTILGPSKAGVISQEAEVPQSKIYEVLEELMKKNLVEVFGGRPKEFKAISPELALRNLLDEKERGLVELRKEIRKLSSIMKPVSEKEIAGGIWTLKGKKWIEFFNKTSEMLDRSRKYVYAITRDFSRSSKLSESAKACIKRGVKIRVIGMEAVNDSNFYKAKWYHSIGIQLKHFETSLHPRIVVVDGKEILIRLDHDPTKRERFSFNSLWSQDPSLVKVIDSYMKHLWEVAEPIDFRKISPPKNPVE